MQTFLIILVFLLLPMQTAVAASLDKLSREVTHKLVVCQAKGELTARQIIAFKERTEAISRQKMNDQQRQNALTKLSVQIDQARRPARIANRSFPWWQ